LYVVPTPFADDGQIKCENGLIVYCAVQRQISSRSVYKLKSPKIVILWPQYELSVGAPSSIPCMHRSWPNSASDRTLSQISSRSAYPVAKGPNPLKFSNVAVFSTSINILWWPWIIRTVYYIRGPWRDRNNFCCFTCANYGPYTLLWNDSFFTFIFAVFSTEFILQMYIIAQTYLRFCKNKRKSCCNTASGFDLAISSSLTRRSLTRRNYFCLLVPSHCRITSMIYCCLTNVRLYKETTFQRAHSQKN